MYRIVGNFHEAEVFAVFAIECQVAKISSYAYENFPLYIMRQSQVEIDCHSVTLLHSVVLF